MKTYERRFRLGATGILLLGAILGCAALGLPAEPQAAPQITNPATDAGPQTPDHAASYYHFMLARRYEELAGIYNRTDYIDKSISEYQQAIAADPASLYLRTQLADLYNRVSRMGDAVREAQAVLKIDPNDLDAHRLLADIYLHGLGEGSTNPQQSQASEAIKEFEAVARLDPSDTRSLVMLGRLYASSHQGKKAQEAFERALKANPVSKGALVYLAELESDEGDYQAAVKALRKIPDSERDPPTLAMLASAYRHVHDSAQAVATYEQALKQDPDNQDIRRAYAEALLESGKADAARVELQKALKSNPEDGMGHLRLGHLDRVEGRFDQARQELDRARTLLPGNPEVSYEQVLLESASGNNGKAIAILQDLLKQSEKTTGNYTAAEANNRAIFLERLGLMYRNEQKYDQAIGVFKQIVALGGGQARRGEALVIETLNLSRQPQKALEEADSAVKAYPQDRPLALLRASLVGQQGRVQEATSDLQKLLKGTPADLEVQMAIAQVYSQARRYPEAEAAAQKAMSLASSSEDKENVEFLMGSIYEHEKKYDRAEAEFRKVLAADPLNAEAANYLGYMLAERGVRLDESVRYVRMALRSDPNNGAYLDSLGWAYLKMHRPDLAQEPLEKAGRLITDDPTILEHLGHLHLALGEERLAIEEWERALKEWPTAVGSDFDAEQAAHLQKQLDALKMRLAKRKDSTEIN